MTADTQLDRARGALLGLAVGDALGTTYEFARLDQPPYPMLATKPATDVVGDGPFGLAPGAITDDTQLAVCLARSLAEKGGFDAADVAARYVAWQDEAFDIGNQTRSSLHWIEKTGTTAGGMIAWRNSGHQGAGNGSLMRTTPIAVALRADAAAVINASIADSMLTHADPRCMLACAAHNAAIATVIAADGVGEDASIAAMSSDPLARGRAMVEAARVAIVEGHRLLRALWSATAASDASEDAGDGDGDIDNNDDDADDTDDADDADNADGDVFFDGVEKHVAEVDVVDVEDVDEEELALVDAARDELLRDLEKALETQPDVYGKDVHLFETAGFVRLAFRLAFWHAAHTPTWKAALVDVASRGGDADTNGAIVGALLGARDGASAIPEAWVLRVLGAKQPGSDEWADAHHPRHLLALVK